MDNHQFELKRQLAQIAQGRATTVLPRLTIPLKFWHMEDTHSAAERKGEEVIFDSFVQCYISRWPHTAFIKAVCEALLDNRILGILTGASGRLRTVFTRYIGSLHLIAAQEIVSWYLFSIANEFEDVYVDWLTVKLMMAREDEQLRIVAAIMTTAKNLSAASTSKDTAGPLETQVAGTTLGVKRSSSLTDLAQSSDPPKPSKRTNTSDLGEQEDMAETSWDDTWLKETIEQASPESVTDGGIEVSCLLINDSDKSSFKCRGLVEDEDDSDAEDCATVCEMLSVVEDDVFFICAPANPGGIRLFSNASTVGLHSFSPGDDRSEGNTTCDLSLNTTLDLSFPPSGEANITTNSPNAQAGVDTDALITVLRESKNRVSKAIDDHFEVVVEVLKRVKNSSENSVSAQSPSGSANRKSSTPANLPSAPSSANASYIFCL
ncbi:hypothetical protein FB446DRAFT_804580 [Lentinula raphanica]|nr:hypothetical protein FB446DRAFT_804580 [Lentinula raphanica]